MPTPILIIIMLIVASLTSAYMTERRCNRESESEWQEITYAVNSVMPKDIYICKRCNYQDDVKHHYCSNCGSVMKNGISYRCYSDKIKLFEKEDNNGHS